MFRWEARNGTAPDGGPDRKQALNGAEAPRDREEGKGRNEHHQ